MTAVCAYLYKDNTDLVLNHSWAPYGLWYTPTFGETRTCFNDAFVLDKGGYAPEKISSVFFYYGPVGALVLVNVVSLGFTMRKVQFLRRGNSVLRRDEDQGAARHKSRDTKQQEMQGMRVPSHEDPKRDAKSSNANSKTLYIKMILMAGAVEFIVECTLWACNWKMKQEYYWRDYTMPHRATGCITDFLRAACVTWLAAPPEGYLGLIRRLLHRGDGTAGRSSDGRGKNYKREMIYRKC